MSHFKEDGVTPKTRPEPHPSALLAEKQERQKRAINHVMLRDNVPHADASKVVEAEGVDALLAKLDAPEPASPYAQENELREKLRHDPVELMELVIQLNRRVSALEAPHETEAGE